MSPRQSRPIATRRLVGYGLPGLPLAALTLPVYVSLPTVYARDLGLGLAAVGLVLLIARIWDMVTDPLIGWASDRTTGRFGRRIPWIVAGTPLVILSAWQLFVPPEGAGIAYLLAWSLALHLAWTMVILPLSALGAELSRDYHERSRITAWREGFVVVGTMVALGLPPLFGYSDAGQAREALHVIAVAVVVATPVAITVFVLSAAEPPAGRASPLSVREGARLIAGNRPFRTLIASYLANGAANGLPATLFLLFVEHRLAAPESAGLLLVLYFAAGILSIPLWLKLSYVWGKHRVWQGAMAAACLVFVTVPLIGPGNLGAFIAVCVLTGLALGADLVLPASMQADVVDLDRLKSGRSRAGLYFALWGMATKLSLALAVGVAFPLLSLAGFDPSAGQAAEGTSVLVALYCIAPVILKSLSIVLMGGYGLDDREQTGVRQAIAGRTDS